MRARALIHVAVFLSVGALATSALAASADDFKAALAKAEAANKQAADTQEPVDHNGPAIAAAKKAADAGKFDEAVAHAQQAEALANGSIAQAKEQEKLWPDAVIR